MLSLASATYLGLLGLPMLIASSEVLPRFVPGLEPQASWVGQLIASAWLAIAMYNWNARTQRLGGIFGRPTVMLNLGFYSIAALGVAKSGASVSVHVMVTAPTAAFAVVYAIAFLKGPFDATDHA